MTDPELEVVKTSLMQAIQVKIDEMRAYRRGAFDYEEKDLINAEIDGMQVAIDTIKAYKNK